MEFPRLKFADSNGLYAQLQHIKSELKEAEDAFYTPDTFHLAEEVGDVIVSAMTMLRIIQRDYHITPEAVMEFVHRKNRERGYEI